MVKKFFYRERLVLGCNSYQIETAKIRGPVASNVIRID